MATTADTHAPRTTELKSWRDGPAKHAILSFVARVSGADGHEPVPVEDRVAVFDNDGTLWCEKPMPIQLDFILRRFVEMAGAEPRLRERQPWKAACERDYGWFGALMAQHYAGDDTNVRVLAGGILAAYDGMSVEEFEARADRFLRGTQHPTLGRGYLECVYAPMLELLALPGRQRVQQLHRLGRRPRLHAPDQPGRVRHPAPARDRQQRGARATRATSAAGRSRTRRSSTTSTTARRSPSGSGAAPAAGRCWRPATPTATSRCCDFTQHADKPSLRLLVLHDDDEREFAYTTGAEQALEQAAADGWTVVSVKDDWTTVF